MPLSKRQSILFTHRVNLWRTNHQNDGTGTPSNPYSLAYSNVKCFREPTDNLSVLNLIGRLEQNSPFSQDLWHFAEDQEIDDGWVIKDISETTTKNTFWMVRGEPMKVAKEGNRDAGGVTVFAPRLPPNQVPSGVS